MKVFIVGNPIDNHDNLPLKLMPIYKEQLPDVEFYHLDPTEELPMDVYDHLIIIDTIVGLDSVKIFNNVEDFQVSPRVTVHDFDLPVNLQLLKKLGKLKKTTIIGVPQEGDIQKITADVISALKSISP